MGTARDRDRRTHHREQHDGENVLAIRLRYDIIAANTSGNNVICRQ
jgi:hypothetical protein